MATFLRIVGRLSVKGAKWAWANKRNVLDWIAAGMAIEWIIDKINSIVR